MRRSLQGIHQLGQALRDFRTGQHIRAVDEAGQIKKLEAGSIDQMANDVYLRGEFPPPGKAKARRAGNTPVDIYQNCLSSFSEAVQGLQTAFSAIGQVNGDDGSPLVDSRGEDPRVCEEWRTVLRSIEDELIMWGRTFKKAFGTKSEPDLQGIEARDLLDPDEDEDSEFDDFGDDQAIEREPAA
jgi:hypothetical protein